MAVRIEKGGWTFIFVIGLGLVAYGLDRYGVVNLSGMFGKKAATTAVDTSKPLAPTGDRETNQVRVRVNIWVGCVGGLVANGGLDTTPGSIYDKKGLKVSFQDHRRLDRGHHGVGLQQRGRDADDRGRVGQGLRAASR